MVAIRIRRGLLGAVAKWASPTHPQLSTVVFRGNKMFATDGHRMVIVPTTFSSKALFGVSRSDIFAAVAAQEALAKEFPSERIESISIAWDPPNDKSEGKVEFHLRPGGGVMTVSARGLSKYPDVETAFKAFPRDGTQSPVGYLIDVAYLSAVTEVVEQNLEPLRAVRVTGCGAKFGDLGERPPLLLESGGGISFSIMPLRDL